MRHVAAELSVSEQSVYDWLRRPEAQRELQQLLANGRSAADQALLGQVQDAVDYIGQVIRGEVRPDPVRLAASRDVLDRVGKPVRTEQSRYAGLDDAQLERIAKGEEPPPEV